MRGLAYIFEEYHKEIKGILYKKCTTHKDIFPEEDEWMPATTEYYYSNDKNKTIGLHPECKRCTVIKSGKWLKDNPESKKASVKKHYSTPQGKMNTRNRNQKWRDNGGLNDFYANNPDSKKKYTNNRKIKNHKIPIKQWLSCKNYFGNACAYCGLPAEKHFKKYKGQLKLYDLHKEHADDQGANDLSNCLPSCGICNSEKHTSSLEKWYNENNPKFNVERLNKIQQWLNGDYKNYI